MSKSITSRLAAVLAVVLGSMVLFVSVAAAGGGFPGTGTLYDLKAGVPMKVNMHNQYVQVTEYVSTPVVISVTFQSNTPFSVTVEDASGTQVAAYDGLQRDPKLGYQIFDDVLLDSAASGADSKVMVHGGTVLVSLVADTDTRFWAVFGDVPTAAASSASTPSAAVNTVAGRRVTKDVVLKAGVGLGVAFDPSAKFILGDYNGLAFTAEIRSGTMFKLTDDAGAVTNSTTSGGDELIAIDQSYGWSKLSGAVNGQKFTMVVTATADMTLTVMSEYPANVAIGANAIGPKAGSITPKTGGGDSPFADGANNYWFLIAALVVVLGGGGIYARRRAHARVQ